MAAIVVVVEGVAAAVRAVTAAEGNGRSVRRPDKEAMDPAGYDQRSSRLEAVAAWYLDRN